MNAAGETQSFNFNDFNSYKQNTVERTLMEMIFTSSTGFRKQNFEMYISVFLVYESSYANELMYQVSCFFNISLLLL